VELHETHKFGGFERGGAPLRTSRRNRDFYVNFNTLMAGFFNKGGTE
jgi:hypothetical protein